MLSYVVPDLNNSIYEPVGTERFENVADLLSELLIRGVTLQLKRGLVQDYIEIVEPMSSLKGRICLSDSISLLAANKQQLVCRTHDFSSNNLMNQVLKTTIEYLVHADIAPKRCSTLRKLLFSFAHVQSIDIHAISWRFCFNSNNQNYMVLMFLCKLVLKRLLPSQQNGKVRFLRQFFSQESMHRLFEAFLVAYFHYHHSKLNPDPPRISWITDDDMVDMQPIMRTDLVLHHGNKDLIIDAKFYSNNTSSNKGGSPKNIASNLYQIFAYVKNYIRPGHQVSGMLLYAKTKAEIQPNQDYRLSGHLISVKTLDLDSDFAIIRQQLDAIAENFIQN